MTAACLLLLLVSTRALVPSLALTVSPLVSDGAVLVAEPAAAHIFGEGAARKQEVRVAIDGQTLATTTANEDGTFGASLPPRKASTTPVTVTVSTDTQQVVVNNILFGEVWACSGQSNMQMTVSSAANATAEILRAKQYKHIRVATVAQISLEMKGFALSSVTRFHGICSRGSMPNSKPTHRKSTNAFLLWWEHLRVRKETRILNTASYATL